MYLEPRARESRRPDRDARDSAALPGDRLQQVLSRPYGRPRQGSRGQYSLGGQRDGRSPAATRRASRARRLSLALLAPGSEPLRNVLVRHDTTLVEFPEARVNLIQLPAFRFHIGGNGFSRKKRLGAPRALCERLELVFGVAVDPH